MLFGSFQKAFDLLLDLFEPQFCLWPYSGRSRLPLLSFHILRTETLYDNDPSIMLGYFILNRIHVVLDQLYFSLIIVFAFFH